jgi:hypothetical protein
VISSRTGAGRRAADPLCSIEEGPIRRDHRRAFPLVRHRRGHPREDAHLRRHRPHEIGFARKVADRVVFLQGGTIVEQGPPEQVLGDPSQPETQEFLRRVMS